MLNICLLAVLFLLQDQPPPLPELKPFLAGLRKNLHTDTHLLSQYTYTEKQTSIQLDSNQKPKKTEVEVVEVFPGSPERAAYRCQIVKNGEPISAAELRKEDQDLQKRIDAAQHKLNERLPAEREKTRAERSRKEEQILDDVFSGYETEFAGR